MPSPVPLVRAVRSGVEEAVHLGSIAVCDARGDLVRAAGDPRRVVFARSTTKPVQASVSLGHIPEDLTDAELAVMAASHNGEPVHLEAVRSLLGRAGLGEDALRCPPALPSRIEDARDAEAPAPIFHNCSGKHAGMLLACARAGFDTSAYLEQDHPLQREVLAAISGATGAAPLAIGVDGCGAPVHAYPLASLATAFARLVRPEHLPPSLAEAATRVLAAMRAAPLLVGGRGRLDSALLASAPVISKIGAEGLICAAIPEEGLGIALKIEDGASRAREPAIVRTLGLLGALDPEDPGLRAFARPEILGGGRPVGSLEPVFDLA